MTPLKGSSFDTRGCRGPYPLFWSPRRPGRFDTKSAEPSLLREDLGRNVPPTATAGESEAMGIPFGTAVDHSNPHPARPVTGQCPITDSIDLARLRARDPELLTALVAEYGARIRAIVCSFERDAHRADDLFQDCWGCIIERLDRYSGQGSFAGWASAVTRNYCRMRARRAKRAPVDQVALEDPHLILDNAPDPEEEFFLRRRNELLYQALGRLPDRERDAIVLRLIEGRGTAETAKALKTSPASARAILARGMTRLRQMKEIEELFIHWF